MEYIVDIYISSEQKTDFDTSNGYKEDFATNLLKLISAYARYVVFFVAVVVVRLR